jgi:hypothetical protein
VDEQILAHPGHGSRPERPSTAVCDGCGERFPRGELVEVQESLTYFAGDLLCSECWHGSDAVVL